MVIFKGCACLYISPWNFSSYFLLLVCSGGGVKGMGASQDQPTGERAACLDSETTSQLSGCDRPLQSWFMLLIWTTEPWGCWKGDSLVGATGSDVPVLMHCSDTAIKEFADEVQSKARRDASPVQNSPSWSTSPKPKAFSYYFILLQICFH